MAVAPRPPARSVLSLAGSTLRPLRPSCSVAGAPFAGNGPPPEFRGLWVDAYRDGLKTRPRSTDSSPMPAAPTSTPCSSRCADAATPSTSAAWSRAPRTPASRPASTRSPTSSSAPTPASRASRFRPGSPPPSSGAARTAPRRPEPRLQPARPQRHRPRRLAQSPRRRRHLAQRLLPRPRPPRRRPLHHRRRCSTSSASTTSTASTSTTSATPSATDGLSWGYNETSIARFNARYGRDGRPAGNDPLWSQWRRDQVTALVRGIYLGALAIKPEVKISAAVIPWGDGPRTDADWQRTAAYSSVFQDWRSWLEEGIVDQVMPMNYFRESAANQGAWFDRWVAWQRDHAYGRQVIPAVALYLNEPVRQHQPDQARPRPQPQRQPHRRCRALLLRRHARRRGRRRVTTRLAERRGLGRPHRARPCQRRAAALRHADRSPARRPQVRRHDL